MTIYVVLDNGRTVYVGPNYEKALQTACDFNISTIEKWINGTHIVNIQGDP